MSIFWLFFFFRCGVDQNHVKQERPEMGVLQANPVFPSKKSTALSNPVPVSESVGPLHPLHPPNATPASLTRTTAVPTSHSPLTRRTCLKWVILSEESDWIMSFWVVFPFSKHLLHPSLIRWRTESAVGRERSGSLHLGDNVPHGWSFPCWLDSHKLCCHIQTLFLQMNKSARNTFCTISSGSVSLSEPRHSWANIP